jgi:hypothetical protein
MPNEKMLTPEEAYLDRVKSARATSAVLKARLITLRSTVQILQSLFSKVMMTKLSMDNGSGVYDLNFSMNRLRAAEKKALEI